MKIEKYTRNTEERESACVWIKCSGRDCYGRFSVLYAYTPMGKSPDETVECLLSWLFISIRYEIWGWYAVDIHLFCSFNGDMNKWTNQRTHYDFYCLLLFFDSSLLAAVHNCNSRIKIVAITWQQSIGRPFNNNCCCYCYILLLLLLLLFVCIRIIHWIIHFSWRCTHTQMAI